MPGYSIHSRSSCANRLLLLITLLFCCNCYKAHGQDPGIDSLKRILLKQEDTARINCLNKISAAYIKFLNPGTVYRQTDSARAYALAALQSAKQSGHFLGIARAYENLGELASQTGKFNKAEPFLRNAVRLYDSLSLFPNLNWVRITLAWVLYEQAEFEEAREILQQASAYYKSASNVMLESRTYRMIGNSYVHQGYFLKGFEFSQKAYEMALRPGDPLGNLFSPQRKGELFLINEDTVTALRYYRESSGYAKRNGHDRFYLMMLSEIYFIEKKYDSVLFVVKALGNHIKEKHNDPAIQEFFLAWNTSTTGQLYRIIGRTQEAIQILQDVAFFYRDGNDVNSLLSVLTDIAYAYDQQRDDKQVIAYANEILALGEPVTKRKFVRDSYWLLWRAYDRQNNSRLAYYAYLQYSKLKEDIESDQYKQKIAAASWIEKEKQLEAELNILNRDNEIKQKQHQADLLIKKILVGGLIGFSVLGLILFRNISLKRRNEMLQNEKKQTALEKKATELEMQMLRAQMSPHFIFNSLNSINHFILQSDNSNASEYLAKFSRLIRLILMNSRSPSIPLENEVDALQLYLELEALRFNHHFGYTVDIDRSIDPSVIKVPPLIIQPYAENAIWHGLMPKEEKGKLEIRVSERDGYLYCHITDDGIGREQAQKIKNESAPSHKSMGMQITAERLSLLRKENFSDDCIKVTDLVLADGRPGGTEVLIKIPLRYD